MDTRKLGNSGLAVAPLAFGCNVFGWTVDQAGANKLLDAFVDAGGNLLDTADVYARWAPGNRGGESETMIGHWLRTGGKLLADLGQATLDCLALLEGQHFGPPKSYRPSLR